jgi:hypothetical protein
MSNDDELLQSSVCRETGDMDISPPPERHGVQPSLIKPLRFCYVVLITPGADSRPLVYSGVIWVRRIRMALLSSERVL